MAEHLLRARLVALGVDAEVGSAGLLEPGVPATPDAVAVLAARGLDAAAHRSRRMGAELIEEADVVIGMERRHLQEAAVLAPDARHRSFTLPDLAERAAGSSRRPDEGLRAWATRLGAGRPTSAFLGTGDDEVDDPIGRSRRAYERTATQLDGLLATVLASAYPSSATLPTTAPAAGARR